MPVTSLAAYQAQKREQWKRNVLLQVEKELDKIHPSNFDVVADKVIDYAGIMGGVYYRTAAEIKAEREERS